MSRVIDKVDVICEHKSDGSVIPMRFRLMNEDGNYEAYTIRGYRQLFHKDTYTTPDGVYVCSKDLVFECRVLILDMYRTIRLYFDKDRIEDSYLIDHFFLLLDIRRLASKVTGTASTEIIAAGPRFIVMVLSMLFFSSLFSFSISMYVDLHYSNMFS